MENIRYFQFRSVRLFTFDLNGKQLYIAQDACLCHFIPADYKLMSDFLLACDEFIKSGKDFESVSLG